jgi:predicted dehydrogenase
MPDSSKKLDRREFMGTAAAAGLMILKPQLVRGTAANSAVRVGLLGCGGRGTADASSLVTNGGARVVALADLFADQLEKGKKHFDELAEKNGYAGIDTSQIFRGPKAYEEIANSKEVDAVVITSPPYFHPQHLETVVEAGKHAYCEKPVAVDVPGAKRVIRAGEKAQGRLSIDVGFQIRNAPPFVELVRRIQGGALGEIAGAETYYHAGTLKRPEWPNASPQEVRIRNWVHDRVLSGDILVEQGIHVVDICNWTLQGHPVKAIGTGARKPRTDNGDAWSHFDVTLFYPGDVHVNLFHTQFLKGWWDVCQRFFGSKGVSEAHYSSPVCIYGDDPWQWKPEGDSADEKNAQFSATGRFRGALDQADPEKHKAFVESITSGKFHNQAAQGADSAMSAMLGREAAYTGREISWEKLLKSHKPWDAKIDLNRL